MSNDEDIEEEEEEELRFKDKLELKDYMTRWIESCTRISLG
jgi:uncharacterized protein YdcH (DUF465 family)